MKFAAQIAYMGGQYCGWQRQLDVPGIQQELELALSKLSNGAKIPVTGAGRTDKGVNALGQVASFEIKRDVNREWEPSKLRLALNFHLPLDIRVMRVWPVSDDFDARYSALWREYKYFIWHGRVCPPPLAGLVWWRKAPWNTEKARAACKLLQGRHDFRAFCKTGECPENSVRDLSRVRLVRWGPMTVLTVRAPSFLMNMVRIITGNIDAIAAIPSSQKAREPRNLEWLAELLTGSDREKSAQTAPACGLWFWRVGYQELPAFSPISCFTGFSGMGNNNNFFD